MCNYNLDPWQRIQKLEDNKVYELMGEWYCRMKDGSSKKFQSKAGAYSLFLVEYRDRLVQYVSEDGWKEQAITQALCDEVCLEMDLLYECEDKPVSFLISNQKYWILKHTSGKFSTIVYNDETYGTLEDCYFSISQL